MASNYDVSLTVLSDRMPEIIARLPTAVDRVMEMGAYAMQAYAKSNHPWQNRTGETEASIEAEKVDKGWDVHFGGASIFLEWGTVHMPPFPFIAPAGEQGKSVMADGLSGLEELL